jgi:FlaA1/EpsC-like NDP-sugar epimerase
MQNMLRRVRNRHLFVSDILLLILVAYLSYALRLDRHDLTPHWPSFVILTVMLMLVTPLVFRWMGIYSRYWRYTSIDELWLLTSATAISVAVSDTLSIVTVRLLAIQLPIPRSIPFILLPLALIAIAGSRLALRLVVRYEGHNKSTGQPKRVLVMGAGDAGAQIVHDLRQNWQRSIQVVGFLDDDPSKHGIRIHGVLVLGDRQGIPSVVRQHDVHQVIIAMPTVPGKVIRQIVRICDQAGVQTKIIPSISELLDGTVGVKQLRNVQIEDLLRRQPVQTDTSAVSGLIRGKRVLVTGAGGSIGSELCRQLLPFEPAELVLLGHGENSIFAIHNELLQQLTSRSQPDELNGTTSPVLSDNDNGNVTPACQLAAAIADIRFPERIRSIFEQYRPEIVFHAAAHKHVPLMELNLVEAITNNTLGTRNLLNVAQSVGTEHFVMISTDKVVNPTSVMGASKRVAELLVHQAAVANSKPYLAVRFGNVLGSRGSVVLTFKQQIASGGPVTITHPEMRRFFMTIPEAVQLVLQAAVLGQGGEVFMLDMGEPVKIVDLARDMIELSGLEVGGDIEIVTTGIRPGEKLYEELFVPGEVYQPTMHEKIFIACNASRFVPADLDQVMDALAAAAHRNDKAAMLSLLHVVIPELLTTQERDKERVEIAEPLKARVAGG